MSEFHYHNNININNIDDYLDSIVNINKYPINNPTSCTYQELVEQGQLQLAQNGSMSFPGFIRDDVIEKMAHEVSELPTHHRLEIFNIYGINAMKFYERDFPYNTKLDDNHPLNRKFVQDVHAVAYDCIPHNSLINLVYHSNYLTEFLAKVLKIDKLYHFGDEFQKLNIMYIYDNGNRGWHFDGSDFVVTLMLQPSLEGGEFEFAPFLRGPQIFDDSGDFTRDENYEGVRGILNGEKGNRQIKKSQAGTLNLFFGMRSLHRVRTVFGPRKRIMSVLSYHREPDQHCPPPMNVSLYGERVQRIYEQRERENSEKKK